MKRRVYLETTIVSYLTSRPSRDVILAARQQITHAWWENRRRMFEVVISQIVLDEAGAGDREATARRLARVAGVPLLDVTPQVATLAATLIQGDIHEFCRRAQERQRTSGHTVVSKVPENSTDSLSTE